MRHGIEAVAFDLDGTLYPNYRLNLRILPFIFKELPLMIAFGKARSRIRKEQIENNFTADSRIGSNFYKYQAELVAKNIKADSAELQQKIDTLIYKGWEPFFKEIKLFKQVKETLAAFKQAGYKLGLLSDFPPDLKLKYLEIDGIWDTVLCSEHSGAIKPHPKPFIELANAMSLPPEKIIYVGNSRPYDIAGAAAAGMKTAWIKNPLFPGKGLKKPKPDFCFNNYRQLYNYMIQ